MERGTLIGMAFTRIASLPTPSIRLWLAHVLTLPDFERSDRIGEFWSYPQSRTFAELLIDCQKDWTGPKFSSCWCAARATS